MFIGHYAVAFAAKRAAPRVSLGALVGAAVVGLVALSHWYLDALVHRPDLPLYPGSPLKVGFAAWPFRFWAEWFDRHRTQ